MEVLAKLSDAEVFHAARLVTTELLRSAITAKEGASTADAEISALVSQLAALPSDALANLPADVGEKMRAALSALSSAPNGELANLTTRTVHVVERAAISFASGDPKGQWIVNTGFALSLLVLVSTTQFSGDIGSFHVEKTAGIPAEVVEIVRSIVEKAPQLNF